MKIQKCRVCDSRKISKVLSLGNMPSVNFFPEIADGKKILKKFPLNLVFCNGCGLVGLDEVVSPEHLFRNYHYLTSASKPLILHFRSLVQDAARRRFFKKGDKVLDIGANDGTLLQEFKKKGAKPLGIDPALNAVDAAKKIGIQVLPHFFNDKTAQTIVKEQGRFQVITSTNVFAHTDNVKSFVQGIDRLLAPNGVFIVECAHLLDMIVKNQFDVIYHEHVSYFSLHVLMELFQQFDLKIFDAKKVLTQGGSIRIYVSRRKGPATMTSRLKALIREENENYLNDLPTLKRFAQDVRKFKAELVSLVRAIKKKNHQIVGLGAPAKGVIMLNYAKLGANDIDYIVDSTPLKQGRLLPGTKIPVYSEQCLETECPDYFLLSSWNFQSAILKKVAKHRAKGAKVIIPFPKLRVI